MRPLACSVALLVGASLLLGCSKSAGPAATRVKVSGKVTLDGKPVQSGRISFDPQNGEPPATFSLLDGAYEGLAPVGKNKVKLSSSFKTTYREWKKTGDGPGYDDPIEVNSLPARYSDGSIIREVTEQGPNEFNFACKSE